VESPGLRPLSRVLQSSAWLIANRTSLASKDISPVLAPARPGVAVLALRSGAPIVPMALWGTETIRPWSFLNPPPVGVRLGPARHLERRRGAIPTLANALMVEIAAMLPPRYRGVYADQAVEDAHSNPPPA